MTSALDRDRSVVPSSRYVCGEDCVSPAGDRVRIRERAQEWAVIVRKRRPGCPVRRSSRIVRRDGHQHREWPSAGFEAVVGKWGLVGFDDVAGQCCAAAAVDDFPYLELWRLLTVALPGQKSFAGMDVAGWQESVGRNHPSKPLRIFRDQAESDQATPVLANQRYVANSDGVDCPVRPV